MSAFPHRFFPQSNSTENQPEFWRPRPFDSPAQLQRSVAPLLSSSVTLTPEAALPPTTANFTSTQSNQVGSYLALSNLNSSCAAYQEIQRLKAIDIDHRVVAASQLQRRNLLVKELLHLAQSFFNFPFYFSQILFSTNKVESSVSSFLWNFLRKN